MMRLKTKLRIGEFSQLMQVTVKTLHHYEQMQRLNNIRALQRMGFTLEEIGERKAFCFLDYPAL